jgi:hypothetical protein
MGFILENDADRTEIEHLVLPRIYTSCHHLEMKAVGAKENNSIFMIFIIN